MQNLDLKNSMLSLRELRDKLCDSQQDQKETHKARDFVIEHLQELHEMICDRKVRRKKLEDKSLFILETFSALPDCDNKGET